MSPLEEPYWRFRCYSDSCYVIEDPKGDPLIGDQLPSTEQEARLLCRVANLARDEALKVERARIKVMVDRIMSLTE